MRGFDSPSTHNSVFEDTTLFNLNYNNMTRVDVICSTFQAPVRDWMINNVLEQRPVEWLGTENENFGNWGGVLKAFVVLDMSFSWADSKEGDEFWREIYNKLKDERR